MHSVTADFSCYHDEYSKIILLVLSYKSKQKDETLMISLKQIGMKRFDKWLFLKNIQKEIIDNIHLKNWMFVYDRKYKEVG